MTSKEVRTRPWSVPQTPNNVDIVQVPLCLRENQFGQNTLALMRCFNHECIMFSLDNVEWFLCEHHVACYYFQPVTFGV